MHTSIISAFVEKKEWKREESLGEHLAEMKHRQMRSQENTNMLIYQREMRIRLNKPMGDISIPRVMRELYMYDSIKSPSHVIRRQKSHLFVSLPCSMNLLDLHIQSSVSEPSGTGSHVLRRQQDMVLGEVSDFASHYSF